MRRRFPLITALAVAALAVVSSASVNARQMPYHRPGGDETEAAPNQEISFELRIGNLVPFTGDLSPFGKPIDAAARIAAEVANESARRVRLDAKVRIVASEDAQTKATAAVEAATKLVQVDEVDVVMGALASASTIPVAQSVTIPNKVVQISPASTSPAITKLKDNGFVWRTPPSDAFQGKVLAQAVADTFGRRAKINTGTRNDAYGTALIGAFRRAWKAQGGRLGRAVAWNPDAVTFDSEARRLVGGNPDGWVIIDFPETWAKVGPALVRTGKWDPRRTFTADGLRDSTLPEDVGRQATAGMRGTAPSSKGAPAGTAFDRLFKRRAPKGVKRQTFDAHAFDAVMVAFLAAVRAASSDPADIKENLRAVSGPPGKKFTFTKLDAALKALMNGKEIDYEGASGPIDFDRSGDPSSAIYEIWQFRGKQIKTIRSFRFAAEAAAPSVTARLSEWKVATDAKRVNAGRVTFTVRNVGSLPHNFAVIRTNRAPNDLPLRDNQAVETGRVGKTPTFGPGGTRTLEVRLKGGKYVLICNVPGHYEAGMHTGLQVTVP